MKKISLVLVMGSILGFVGPHAFAADVENADSHCSQALQLIDKEAKSLLYWWSDPDSDSSVSYGEKCLEICDQQQEKGVADREPDDQIFQTYSDCSDGCSTVVAFDRVQTKLNHYRENWINAQKEGCDLAPYEADHTKIENIASLNEF